MYRTCSLDKINEAIRILKGADLKITQRRVAQVSGLSSTTVKKYWLHKNVLDEWYIQLYKKIYKIKRDRGKYNIAMQQLKIENDNLREQNRQLALRALGLIPI